MNPITCKRPALLAAMVLTIFPLQTHAEPEPAATEGGQEPGISLLLGALVVRTPQFAGNRDVHHSQGLPWIVLAGEHWFLDTASPEIGFSIWKTKNIKLDVLMQPRYGFEPDGDPLLSGLNDRGTTAEAGVRAQWSHAGYTAQFGYYTGAGGNSAGQAAAVEVAYVFASGPWALMPALEWRWEDRALVHHQYGINAAQARADRSMYRGEATFIGGPGLTAIYQMDTWIGFGSLLYQHAGDGIRHSPIVGRGAGFTASMGMGWTL